MDIIPSIFVILIIIALMGVSGCLIIYVSLCNDLEKIIYRTLSGKDSSKLDLTQRQEDIVGEICINLNAKIKKLKE